MHNRYYVYFMSNNWNNVLYIGVTNDIRRRVLEHKTGENSSCFTKKYKCTKLVYVEEYGDINQAIAREKQLKGWRRDRKNELVVKKNPAWQDLWEG